VLADDGLICRRRHLRLLSSTAREQRPHVSQRLRAIGSAGLPGETQPELADETSTHDQLVHVLVNSKTGHAVSVTQNATIASALRSAVACIDSIEMHCSAIVL